MPSKEVEFHEEALAEAQAAYDWYATRNAAAAEAFIGELDHAVERIGMLPEASTSYVSGTRRYVLKRFPFHGDLPRTEKSDSNCCCCPWSPKTGLLEKESQTLSGPRPGPANRKRILAARSVTEKGFLPRAA